MNDVLNTIVGNEGSITESVNKETLSNHAKMVDTAHLDSIRWNRIRQLHILGCDKYITSRKATGSDLSLRGCYVDEDQTWVLVIGADVSCIRDYVSRCSQNLRELNIRFTTIESLDVSLLTGIQCLNLSDNGQLRQVDGLDQLQKVKQLNLNDTHIGPCLELNHHPHLSDLHISHSKISRLILRQPLPRLSIFYAAFCPIEDAGFLHLMPSLQSVSLTRTLLADPARITFPPSITHLYLDLTRLTQIPDGIRNLKKLRRLNVSGLSLQSLPRWLPDFLSENPKASMEVANTTVAGLDTSIFDQPSWTVIRQWLIERKNDDGKPLNELKVVFLGDGSAGKSYTIARLLADGQNPKDFSGKSTPGIVITDKEYHIDDRDVQIHFWDFGGQEILHSMHRMFLTDRTLYVVVLNVRDGTQDERAQYWLHNIKSFAGNAPVLVVLNRMDENPNASINENDLRRMAPGMTETVKMSALGFSPEEFNNIFTAALLRQIGRMSETLDFFFPAAWTKVKRSLQTMESHYIHGSDYSAICEEYGVRDEDDLRKGLLKWFNDLGISFCYGGDAQLENYVILRPDWLTNAIYILLFNKLENVRNGIVPMDTIYRVLQLQSSDEPIRSVLTGVTYTEREVSYVLNVIRKFRLSFAMDATEEFIPMLCDRNSPPIADEEDDPATLEFWMEYEYLPNNVLHRLMVQLRGHLDTQNVWFSGARFHQESTGYSAVVKKLSNTLKIFVRSAQAPRPTNKYLKFIIDVVDQINLDMGLTPPVKWVIYKSNGITDKFDYQLLIESLEQGMDKIYSKNFHCTLNIADILKQTGPVPDESMEKLLEDIQSICISMQALKLYWNADENDRNDYIRNMLRSKKYIVSDQSRNGVSAGGKDAGELDMDIRQKPNDPWTIYEALNIKGTADKTRWNAHLDKLLKNYNPNGLPFLFLVSYLECSRNAFPKIADAYDEHMRCFTPNDCEAVPNSFAVLDNAFGQLIHVSQRTYYCGVPTTVYHILVHLENKQEELPKTTKKRPFRRKK